MKYNEKAARKAATIAAGEVVKGVDPNDAKREAATGSREAAHHAGDPHR
jgi:hypothetical protein